MVERNVTKQSGRLVEAGLRRRVEDFEGIGAFLCSNASAFISGETIKVDGGYMIRG